jgi:CHAD domain-containing protein
MVSDPSVLAVNNAPVEDTISEALGQAYTVTADSAAGRAAMGSGARRRTWLDTFDWRLYAAGLTLEHEQTRRGGRLILTDADAPLIDQPLAEQPVTAWQSGRGVIRLPDGPVADRIGSLISPRALLPVARAVSTRSVFRLLNTDGKTVARVLIDRTTTAGTELSPRVQVAEVRGYPAQARRAAAIIAAAVAPAAESLFVSAAVANGALPGGYSGKVDAAITADMPARLAVATLLSSLLDTLEQNVDGVLRDIDTEFLHDLRVAVRRTRSGLKLLGDVLPADLAARYKDEFKWLGDTTTPLRDLDVHLLGFGDLADGLLAATPDDLEPFRGFLVRQRAREFRRLAAHLRSARFRALTSDWRKALTELTEPGAGGGAGVGGRAGGRRGKTGARAGTRAGARSTAGSLATERTARAVLQLTRRGAAISAQSPAESLHDLRKRGKELRYLLEFFAPLYDRAAYRTVLSDLKKLQDCLGDFQDSQVQREEITALARQLLGGGTGGAAPADAGAAALAATLLALGEINARLAANQQQARADFGSRFTRFAAPATQRHIQTLLTQGTLPALPPQGDQ